MRDDGVVLTRPGPVRDRGFTLVELVIAIAILGLVMVAVTSMLFVSLTANTKTRQRLDSSRSEQFAAAYFADDVQGAGPGGIVTSGTARCGSGGELLLELRGESYDATADDPSAERRITMTTYALVSTELDGVPARELHRRTCEAERGAATPLEPNRDLVVARALADERPQLEPQNISANTTTVAVTFSRVDGTSFTLVGSRRTR